MNNKIKTIKCDFWNHQPLSRDILDIVRSVVIPSSSVDGLSELNCVPKMRKPHFWEFWKWSEYNRECQRILNEVEKYCEEAYLNCQKYGK